MPATTTIYEFNPVKRKFNPKIDNMGIIIDRALPVLKHFKKDITGRLSLSLNYGHNFSICITYYNNRLIVHDNGYIQKLMSTTHDVRNYTSALVSIYNQKSNHHVKTTHQDTQGNQITYMPLRRFSDETIVSFVKFLRWTTK